MGNKTIFKCVKKGDNEYQIIASTPDIDRDGEIVVPTGVNNLDSYLKNNPVILAQHDWWGQPIGKAVNGYVDDNGLYLDIVFADTQLGKEYEYLYSDGFMNSFSIGFSVKSFEDKQEGDIKRRYFTEWELLEVSAVTIPANPNANILREAEKAGHELTAIKSLLKNSQTQTVPVPEGDRAKALRSATLRLADKITRRN